jgi:hypothetical protein
MFKISYTVDDKRLPEMIRATFDHVTDLKVTPMDAAPAATTSLDKPRSHHKVKLLPPPQPKKVLGVPAKFRNFIQELGWEKGRQFGGEDVAKRCSSLGLDIASRWYVIGNEVKHKRVRKVSLGRYVVL